MYTFAVDYGAILHRSWGLTKKHKWLWVYGLVLAVFGGGSGGGGGGGSGGSSTSGRTDKKLPENLPEKTSQVLGAATEAVKNWFVHVPATTWIGLGLLVFLLLVLFLITRWILVNWAKAGLIAGLAKADKEEEVSLVTTTGDGLRAVKPLVVLDLVGLGAGLLATLGLILVFGLLALLIWLVPDPGRIILWVIEGIIALPTAIGVFLLLGMVGIYADRLIVLEGVAPVLAWKKGLGLGKGNFLPTVVMGIINSAVGCGVGCLSMLALLVVLGIPGLVMMFPYFRGGWHWPPAGIWVGMGILGMIFIYANLVVKVILTVFSYGNWNLFFKRVRSKESGVRSQEYE